MDSLDFTPWLMDINPSKDIAMEWLETIVPAYTQPKIASDLPKMAESRQTRENELYADLSKETHSVLLKRARKALERIPDASCDSIAAALGLKPHSVRALSKGNRKGAEFYSKTEILNIINTGEI